MQGQVLEGQTIAAERELADGEVPRQRGVHARQRQPPDQLASAARLHEHPGDAHQQRDDRQRPERDLARDPQPLPDERDQNASPIAMWSVHMLSGTGVATPEPPSPKQLSLGV